MRQSFGSGRTSDGAALGEEFRERLFVAGLRKVLNEDLEPLKRTRRRDSDPVCDRHCLALGDRVGKNVSQRAVHSMVQLSISQRIGRHAAAQTGLGPGEAAVAATRRSGLPSTCGAEALAKGCGQRQWQQRGVDCASRTPNTTHTPTLTPTAHANLRRRCSSSSNSWV